MKPVSRTVTATILSMSLLTVMAAAAIAPAMGIIRQHFASAPDMAVQLIISLPALFIIMTNLCFPRISRSLGTKTIAVIGLVIYICAGAGCYFIDNIAAILVMRALLGVSVGLIMPLSTGLLSYYFPPEEQAGMMGLSAAMNQMGGVVGTFMAGILASIDWNCSFLVYLFGIIALIMICVWLPNDRLASSGTKALDIKQLVRFHPSVVGMFLLTVVFFVFPTNFAMITDRSLHLDTGTITMIMVALDLLAFFVGLVFGRLMGRFRTSIKYFPPVALIIGYGFYAYADGITMLLIGSAFIGLGNGIGVPYMMTIGSIKGGREAATTVMPLLSAALYLGQFISPIIITPSAELLFGASDITGPYKVAVIIAVIYLIQVCCTRNFQSLPPEKK